MDRSTEFEDLAFISQEAIDECFEILNNAYLLPQLSPPSTPSPPSTQPTTSSLSPSPPPTPSPPPSPPLHSPSTPPPPFVPAECILNLYPQPVGGQRGGYSGFTPVVAAPQMQQIPMISAPTLYNGPCLSNLGYSGYLYSQTGAYSQGQNENPLILRLDNGFIQPLHPVGTLNGKIVYVISGGYYHPHVSAAPPWPNTFKSRRRPTQQEDSAPYVKKPPNAFMLFMKEHRPNVDTEIKSRGSAAVSIFLGQIWRSLTKEEKAKYYDQANQERRLHEHEYPDWSFRENYGKKRKRVKCRAPTNSEASAPALKEEPQQASRLCATPPQTPVMELSSSEACAREVPQTNLHMNDVLRGCWPIWPPTYLINC